MRDRTDCGEEEKMCGGMGDVSPPPGEHLPIVGIGASAGGLVALEAFFAHMPDEIASKMCFVVVQHLAPNYKSILGELLATYSSLHVYEAQDGMAISPHSIYVCHPNRDLTIRQGRLHLSESSKPRSMRFPVDVLLRSLAQDQKERSVCIILSGGGSDGTLGLKAVKSEGGVVFVQDPDSAEHKSMPRSAIATGLVDYVLSPEEMPAQLADYVRYAWDSRKDEAVRNGKLLHEIHTLLHAQTGHDFSGYKQSTIARRVERRLIVNQIESLDDYLRYLQQNPLEVESLFHELLVRVTRFFRDPEAFDSLRHGVVPQLFAGKNPADPVRVWVPGCSTGEEAYSLAILLAEYLEQVKQPLRVQIFATDIDSRAIDQARQGSYPASIAADISRQRLERFFSRDANSTTLRIQKSIREAIVFAEHNVTRDPPFSGLDLISCRNLLIFMERDLQKKALHLFHYALKPGGFLFLGTSETTGAAVDYYSEVDRKWKIYQSNGAVRLPTSRELFPFLDRRISRTLGPPKFKIGSIREFVESALLERYAPACVAINKSGGIIFIHGRTGKYLEPAPGEGSLNIVQMAREGLKMELAAAIRRAASENELVCCRGLRVREDDVTITVNLTVIPYAEESPDPADPLLVVFEEVAQSSKDNRHEEAQAADQAAAAAESKPDSDEHIMSLERELHNKEKYLQALIEELQSSNEELQSTSEEYQSTNEELETSSEELQSVNEELVTVNAELQSKIEELSRSNNDMNNMMSGTGVGTVFIDHQLRIQRFTPQAAQVINLINTDLGRPISHLASNLVGYNRLEEDVQSVLDTLVPKEMEVRTRDELWYLMRILPYRTTDNITEGAVITFVNITQIKRMQQGISRLGVVVRDSNDAVTVQDLDGKILAWNPGAEKLYGWSEAEALGMNIREMVVKGGETLTMIRKLAENEKPEPLLTERLTKDGKSVGVWMTATVLLNEDGQPYAIATTERRS